MITGRTLITWERSNSKRRSKEEIGQILGVDGHLTSKEKAKALNAFFASVFNINDRRWDAHTSKLEYRDWGSSDFSSRGHLNCEGPAVSVECL